MLQSIAYYSRVNILDIYRKFESYLALTGTWRCRIVSPLEGRIWWRRPKIELANA